MRIATLGPAGTFSHEAALNYDSRSEIIFTNSFWEIFELVKRRKAELGIVPVENSITGHLSQPLDLLTEYGLGVIAEIVLPITYVLVGRGKLSEIKKIYSHEQAYEQCARFVRRSLPEAAIIKTASNASSAEIVAELSSRSVAAITSSMAAKLYKLKIIKKGIEDHKINKTRFLVISRKRSRAGKKTSLVIMPREDRPGLLCDILRPFAQRKINLTKIESRPSKRKLGEYIFHIDLDGNPSQKAFAQALREVKAFNKLIILGSYDVKKCR